MKLSVSERGWSFPDVAAFADAARRNGFTGLELYDIHKKRAIWGPGGTLSGNGSARLRRTLAAWGMKVACVDTSCEICGDEAGSVMAMLPQIRDMGCTELAVCAHGGSDEEIRQSLQVWAAACAENGVTLLIKTKGIYADTKKLRSLLDSFASDEIGALWDVHHPFRFFDETPETTFANLGALVKHVHVKDSLKINGEIKYKMMGYGDVPVIEAMNELKNSGYDGFISLEWLKRWNPDLQEPGIVFAHYKSYMDFILSQNNA